MSRIARLFVYFQIPIRTLGFADKGQAELNFSFSEQAGGN